MPPSFIVNKIAQSNLLNIVENNAWRRGAMRCSGGLPCKYALEPFVREVTFDRTSAMERIAISQKTGRQRARRTTVVTSIGDAVSTVGARLMGTVAADATDGEGRCSFSPAADRLQQGEPNLWLVYIKLEMALPRAHHIGAVSHAEPDGPRCKPHSRFPCSSHHQRPARSGSPGATARVQGAQPTERKPRSCRLL